MSTALIGKPIRFTRRGTEITKTGVLLEIEPRGYLVEFASGLRMGLVGDLWDVEPLPEPIRNSSTERES